MVPAVCKVEDERWCGSWMVAADLDTTSVSPVLVIVQRQEERKEEWRKELKNNFKEKGLETK